MRATLDSEMRTSRAMLRRDQRVARTVSTESSRQGVQGRSTASAPAGEHPSATSLGNLPLRAHRTRCDPIQSVIYVEPRHGLSAAAQISDRGTLGLCYIHNHGNAKRSVLILSGGTAGWMLTTSLAKASDERFLVASVEYEGIHKIGVYEATVPNLQRAFLNLTGLTDNQSSARV